MDAPVLAFGLFTIMLAERTRRLQFAQLPVLRPYVATDLVYLGSSAIPLALWLRQVGVELNASFGSLVPEMASLSAPVTLLSAIVLYDLGGYFSHWLLHRSAVLWRFHKVHHSSRTLDWLATFRGHIFEHALRHLVSTVALVVIGLPVWSVAAAAVVYTLAAALGHSNLNVDLRFIEKIFITPRLHRLHHAVGTSDRNLGTIFSIWDRLRGLLADDPGLEVEPLGVPSEVDTYPQSWLPQLLEPLRSRSALPRPGG